jgi:flagellar protein FliS
VLGASPHHLIVLLYQGAREAVAQARRHLHTGDVAKRGQKIGKAIRLVELGLQQSLNMEAGGEIAQRLDRLYSYIARRLLLANLQSSEPILIEVDSLLATLEAAWVAIGPEVARLAAQASAER